MYYHIVKKDGLKYKDLDIKEVDKIIKKEKLNFNNSRIYSSVQDLEHTFKIFEDEESRNLPQILDRNEIRISDILSCKQKKKYLKNCSYDFFLKIFNSSFKPRGKVFLNKTFIIWIMLLSTILNRYLFYILYKYYYSFTSYKLFFGFNIKPLWYITLIYILVPLTLILLIWYRDKYFKENYLIIFIVLMVIINGVIAYTIGDIIENIVKNFGGLVAIIIGLIFTQLFYNLFRRLSYNKYKDF
ncbi:hypothetical protein LDK18_00370 [Fusobacterium nucleatum subsp. nucleatum ATCC 23726]|uniref:Uncharacterized protein n=1 Tax=Fusobacterium nucleatum subsp. nucleatum (strain ATCC 23726 / VPI 4351) TaxID=525283 RepID=D5RCQ6_FUSN2|nr:hypothetical protein [Fusobacterium nucleatum]AVQ22789.1 hypothetical protein C4N14_03710 [Fusobacterium nucleatum subsp. nucleatum ATCC 23726]EFG95361.1 hypothetical protein HMPREF0397_0991 [Fusobacterium nucleatum subsp. nucleatum ATCC 23726]ERT43836.1 hypothetical protein HMPREF1539_00400 [Fusobacterium nucleatum CTI-2]